MKNNELLTVIVPMYFEEEVADTCYRRLTSVLSVLEMKYELIFVNDGSTDRTLPILKSIAEKDDHVRILSFSRNFGHQVAISAGLDFAQGDAVVIIDADLQDPPELIPKMIELWRQGYKVVYAKRRVRQGESVFKRATASLFYRFLNRLSDVKIPLDTGDYRLMDRVVVMELRRLRERRRFVRGLVAWVGFRQTALEYERDVRLAGVTKYPLRKMLRFAMDGIASFSEKPLKVALNLGFLSVGVGLALVVYAVISKLYYPETTISGWASLLISMVFFGGIQLITIGIIGEYIGRMYEESKGRPLYIIEEKTNIPD